ncbi:MAG: sensor histidine kinase, partial [Bacilli bacterium]
PNRYFSNKERFAMLQKIPLSKQNDVTGILKPSEDYSDYFDLPLIEDLSGYSYALDRLQQFDGTIALDQIDGANTNWLSRSQSFKQKQYLTYGILLISIAALFAAHLLVKKQRLSIQTFGKYDVYFNRIPVDLRVVTGILLIGLMYMLIDDRYFFFSMYDWVANGSYFNWVSLALDFSIAIAAMYALLGIVKLLWQTIADTETLEQQWISASFLHRMLTAVQESFLIRKIGWFFITLVVTIVAFSALIMLAITSGDFAIFCVLLSIACLIGIPFLLMAFKRVAYFNKIVLKSTSIVNGTETPELKQQPKFGVLNDLGQNLNTLNQGYQKSQKAQVKSERLKTELITNVSHDLRTPLTSIITYSDLLKQPNLTDDERSAYIEIVDRKAKRLKVLIDDLFEASKMASGNIDLQRERIDVIKLLNQSLAEHDEEIQGSSLQFRFTHANEPLYAEIDGRKMWRVFDNLIANALKYSLEHTRVYIDAVAIDGNIIITAKNIAKYELGGNVDELFERFKRGDDSRHTEGSGLGLAIAKSIVDLHDGTMKLEVDGDLFKIIITLRQC